MDTVDYMRYTDSYTKWHTSQCSEEIDLGLQPPRVTDNAENHFQLVGKPRKRTLLLVSISLAYQRRAQDFGRLEDFSNSFHGSVWFKLLESGKNFHGENQNFELLKAMAFGGPTQRRELDGGCL